jgi:WD40 repeat protein
VPNTSLSHVAWTKDGRVLSAGGGQLFVFDAASGKVLSKIPAGIVESLALSPDSELVATGGDDAQVRVWGLADGLPRAGLGAPRSGAHAALFSPDASRIVTGGGGGIYIWDAATGGVLAHLGSAREELDAPTLSPDGELLAAVDERSASVWEVATAKRRFIAPAPRSTGDPPAVRFSPDARRLAVSSGGKVAIWDATRKRVERTLDLGNGESAVPEWSADTRFLALRAQAGVVLFDTKTWKRRFKLEASKIVGWGRAARSSFSPDGEKLVLATDQHLGVFDVSSGALESTLSGRALFAAPRFSPDGRLIAYATRDRAIALWDGHSPAPTTLLKGPELGVRVIAWSPDGRRIAASSDEGTVRVWNVASGELIAEFPGHEARVWSLEWHPKADVLLSASHHARLLRLRDGVVITLRPVDGVAAGLAHAQSGSYAGDDAARAVLALRVGAQLVSSRLLPAPNAWRVPSLLADFWAGKPISTTISQPLPR